MPTTAPLVFRGAEAELLASKSTAPGNRDLLAIVTFTAIGLAATIGFAALFPLAANAAAVLWAT